MTEGTAGDATALLVLGMHRSGTSAVTRVLNLLGAHLGDDLLAAKADNTRGFWEHAGAVAIHERLLAALGRTWHDTRELPHGWLDSSAAKLAVAEIVSLIERDMRGKRLWAVKDPRMCRLAPIWIQALQGLGFSAKAVLVVREPYEVASSLHVRDGWSYAHAYLMWAQHLLDACRASAGIPRALLSYDQLMDNWKQQMARLGRELDVVWKPDVFEAGPSIAAFLTPTEKHHYASARDVAGPSERMPPAYLGKLYDACVRVSENADWARLDDISRQFEETAALFAGPMQELTRERDEISRIRGAQEALALDRLEHIHRLQAELDQRTKERDGYEVLAVDRLERIQRLDGELAHVIKESARMELLALERLDRIRQLEAERTGILAGQQEAERLAGERLEHFRRAEADIALHVEQVRQLREQLERLLVLAGSRWWLLKRVVRPVKSSAPRNGSA